MEHYQHRHLLRRIEQCFMHIDIASLDLHQARVHASVRVCDCVCVRVRIDNVPLLQVVTLCRRQHLMSALVYIYNRGFDDYVTPMEDLLGVMGACVRACSCVRACACWRARVCACACVRVCPMEDPLNVMAECVVCARVPACVRA